MPLKSEIQNPKEVCFVCFFLRRNAVKRGERVGHRVLINGFCCCHGGNAKYRRISLLDFQLPFGLPPTGCRCPSERPSAIRPTLRPDSSSYGHCRPQEGN